MTKSGIDKMLDSIKNRDAEDPIGLGSKKDKSDGEHTTTKKRESGFGGIIDSIQERDADDPTGTKSKKKEKTDITEEKKVKNRRSGGFSDIIDSIQDRDTDDPTGTKSKKKEPKESNNTNKSENDGESNPLHDLAKNTAELMGAGIVATVGIGAMKGLGGLGKGK